MKKSSFYLLLALSFTLVFSSSCQRKKAEEKNLKLSDRIIKFTSLGTTFTKELNEKLYKAVIDGQIKAYRFDSLTPTCMFKANEVAKISTMEESVQYAPDSTHPDFLVDTVIKQVFKTSDIAGYSVGEKWSIEPKENSIEGEIFAFALNWKPTIAGIALRESPLFWVDYKDVQKLLSKGQQEELENTIYNTLIEKLSE
jgi:hypothetical protein